MDTVPRRARRTPYAAGLLGYAGIPIEPERLNATLERAPWRGQVTAQYITSYGGIIALGESVIYQYLHIAAVVHGRIDNIDALAHQLRVPTGDVGAVIASTYLKHGDEFARKLIGDFAIVLLDDRRQVVLGARDWIGARPLYWRAHRGMTAFGSEVKQVLALLDRPFEIDDGVLAQYEHDQPIPYDATFAAGVKAVLPSGQVRVQGCEPPKAWRCPVRFRPIEIAPAEASLETRRLLAQAVGRRTVGAHALGALVSGGMDSTSVAATAAFLSETVGGPRVAHAYTASYPSIPESDETDLARLVAERWGMCAVPVVIDPSTIPAAYGDEVALHDGPPFPNVGQPQVFAQAAARGTDVLLTGQMADVPLEQRGSELLLSIMGGDWPAALRWSTAYARHAPIRGMKIWARGVRRRLRGQRAEELFERRLDGYAGRLPLELEERAGVRAGVRVESPFADEELLRFLAGIPANVRSDAHQRRTKAVLRAAMDGLLPNEVRLRQSKPTFDAVLSIALRTDTKSVGEMGAHAYAAAFRTLHGAGAREP